LADFLQTIHPEERAQVESLLSAALVSHRNFAMEYRSWNPQLQEFQWFAARGRMVLDDHGELLAVEGTCQDVTERRLNEEVLRERDERRRLAVDSVGSVVWMFDPELRVVEVIACAKEWSSLLPKMRFTIAEAIEMLHPDDREAVLPNIHISPDGGQPAKFQVRIVHQDQVRWVSCSANFVRVAADDSLKVFGISQDITEQVNLQEKLAAQNQQLLHAARLSTLGTLTAVMSHELSQPFTAIANFASAAKAVVDSPKPQDRQLLHQYLEKISLQSVRAGSIIRNLRSFSRKSDRELHHTDLTQIIADSLGMLQLELRQRRIRVEWDRSQRNPWLAIDPVQLQQLLINLLTNALDAVEKNPIGQRLIFIGTRRDPENLGIWIEVADNGGGVPAHIQPNLFQPFVCGKAQGTGIGLSICRDIVNNHRGKIEYRPRLGGGAVFAVWFPAEGQR
jgi:signal transduction histidine kinase